MQLINIRVKSMIGKEENALIRKEGTDTIHLCSELIIIWTWIPGDYASNEPINYI